MLQHVFIKHFALIDKLDIELNHGATMITGETGAGKSIILGAIELALGQRSNSQIVKPGAKSAEVILDIDINQQPQIINWLKDNDFDSDNHCLLRRMITTDGKSRCYINDTPTTAQNLKQLGQLLMNIHGQHDNHLLLKSQEQLRLLDAYADNTPLLQQIGSCVTEWQKTHRQYTALKQSLYDNKQRAEYLRFQLDEFKELGLSADEIIKLPEEHKRLANSDDLIQGYQQAIALLKSDNEHNDILTQSGLLNDLLSNLAKQDHRLQENQEISQNILILLDELHNNLHYLLDSTDVDPSRLSELDQQLSQLHDMSRKHHVSIEELPEHFNTIMTELNSLENIDDDLSQLEARLNTLEQEYETLAKKLSKRRMTSARKLNNAITALIKELGMPKATFEIAIKPQTDNTPTMSGSETVEFQVQTNPGLAQQALSKIASGGELSRISLAIQVVMAKQVNCPTLFFDEVDVGIGGTTAATVGSLLRQLGNTHQVITITHQPQVAASGNTHWSVQKTADKTSTNIEIKTLTREKRIEELARMLGGLKITTQTKAHAKEMLELHQEISIANA